MNDALRKRLNKERGQTLLADLQEDVFHAIACLEEDGFYPLITQATRTNEMQTALYAQGRESLAEVNRLRAIAGESPITEDENKSTVTDAKAGSSKHNFGRAIDIVNYPNNAYADWDNIDFYQAVRVYLSQDIGWVWGGDWSKRKDYGHFEK
jgi:hypothetical protein